MDQQPSMDLELFEALLANMQQNMPHGSYDDVDDDDDDDYDDDDDDDDDDYDYGGHEQHNIHTMANPYGGGDVGGEMGGGVSLPTMQTMSILQGLLNMNPSALPGGVPDMGGAMSGPMSGGMGGMGSAIEGAASSFLSNMPSFLPASMNTEMASTLAGAFGGGMNALMDGFAGAGAGGATVTEYDDDILSDEEDEEDDEDDEDDDELEERGGVSMAAAAASLAAVGAAGAVGGLMAVAGAPSAAHLSHQDHPGVGFSHPYNPSDIMPATSHAQGGPVGFTHPTGMLSPPTSHPHPASIASGPMHHTSIAPSMSGGSVRSVDPLAGVGMGLAGVAAGAGILAPVVSGLLATGTKSPSKLDTSDVSSGTLVGDDSLNSSSRTLPPTSPERPQEAGKVAAVAAVAAAAAAALDKTHISQTPKEEKTSSTTTTTTTPTNPPASKPAAAATDKPATEKKEEKKEEEETKSGKEEVEDDKASVGADSVPGSEEAGDGKSDTESERKKTPSPVPDKLGGRLSPTGSESTPVLESASCASITDLASATESMRDSDTDNHSDAHNVTANLSDLDEHDGQPKVRAQPQYAIGSPLPIVIEQPAFGWQSMVGLDNAKEALKNMFLTESFPEVYEGTQGICKGVLLFGPSGSGKTCLARALAKEARPREEEEREPLLVGISTAYLASQPPNDAPKIVRYLFDHARMHGGPTVMLMDEIDALCYDRNSETAYRAKAELLAQIRGLTTLHPPYPPRVNPVSFNEGLMVVGTTNQPWLLEDELRRIFAYNIHVRLPGEKAREELFRVFLGALPHSINDDQFKCLVAKSEGYSALDINNVVSQVARLAASSTDPNYIQNVPKAITFDDLATVMTDYRCRFTEEASVKYQSYIKTATHRSEERREDGKGEDGKGKPKGVKKFGQRLAKSIAAALVAVID